MATNVLKRSTTAPPRTLHVQKFAEARASEIESLQTLISARLNDDYRSRRNKRRRTTSFVNKKRWVSKRRKVDNGDGGGESGKKVSRKVRRRIELKKNNVSGFSCSGDGTKRLRTHVWHAKRFSMIKRWGFYLPLGLHGRGRGSRALLKRFREGGVVHDASYHSAIQLEGPEESLLSILNVMLMPSPLAYLEERFSSILNGVSYGRAMLHHVEGLASRPVAPVTYIWRPIRQQSENIVDVDKNDACKELQSSKFNRHLWVWIHASAFSEGYNALKSACQKEMNEKGVLVNCLSLEGELAKLELMGPKASQLLQRILEPTRCNLNKTWSLRKHSVGVAGDDNYLRGSSIFQSEESIAHDAVITLNIQDPRTLPEKTGDSYLYSTGDVNDVPKCEAGVSASSEENKRELTLLDSELEDISGNLDSRDIWDISTGISPPYEESVICKEKHFERMKYFCLDGTNMEVPSTSTKMEFSKSCPIMLLKDKYGNDAVAGWYIILPISWVRVFWVSLVTNGAHAIGVRETQWIASEVGLPYYPSDFPESNAYNCLKACEAAESDIKAQLRPPAVRPARIPIPPPWDSILVTFEKGPIRVQVAAGKETLVNKSFLNSNIVECDKELFGHNSSIAVVARTSAMLKDFLDKIHGGYLPHFAQVPNKEKDLINLEKDKNDHNGTCPINYGVPLCLLRVHIRAHKEGVFEEGAIVCAPHSSDIQLLTSRSGFEEGKLQISQSSVGSYFMEQSSGKWKLNVPEDPVSLNCYRWPIGFITTGFLRGSKRTLAQAYCESVLLAHLREEQWNGKPVKHRKKDIYVLVRNLRSSAYRLAYATIVLEHQDTDLEYM